MTISFRKLLAVILLFSSSFAWFFIFFTYFENLISPGLSLDSFLANAGSVIFLISCVIFAFIGGAIAEKVNLRKFLILWILFGLVVLLPLIFFRGDEFLIFFAILGGLAFGLGFTPSLAFFAESTTPDERGRVAGVMILVAFVLVVFSSVAIVALGLESITILSVFVGVKSIGFLSLLLDPVARSKNKAKPWRMIFSLKDFNYYLLALVLFYVAAGLVSLLWIALPNTPEYEAALRSANIIRYIGLGIFAILAGILADRIGRKKPIILGLIMLGAGYAIVGLMTTPETYFVNLLLSGLAWGVIMVVYLVVPADLSPPGSAERFYAIGWLLPLMIYIGLNGSGRLLGFVPPVDIFSAILSIILFTSILPILYAVETLSESKIRERRFRDYTEKVGKIIQDSKKPE
ncbi:MAG: MFS transporter [Candidatus Bathyarchaeota archaeon]|nr:MFS transporter [Candidatus Bathyarchaeota archaeon]